MISRTQALVLWFVLVAWLSLIVILVTAPEVYDDALPALGHRRAVEIAFLVLLSAFSACWLSVCFGAGGGSSG
jgi:hypothetical protein